MPVGVRGWRLLPALALLAVLTALAGGLLPSGPAAAQETPTWDENGNLELSPEGVEVITDGSDTWKCARFPAGSPYELRMFNNSTEFYGICMEVGSSGGQGIHGNSHIPLEFHFSETAEPEALIRLSVGVSRYQWEKGTTTLNPPRQSGYTHDNLDMTGSLVESDRFSDQSTKAIKYGASCRRSSSCISRWNSWRTSTFNPLATGDTTTLTLKMGTGKRPDNILTFGTPSTPDNVDVSRSSDYTEVTLTWRLYDPVSTYEIQRLEATTVTVGDATRIEYGNSEIFEVDGTIEGVDSWTDATVDPETTYQYRIRAKGAAFSAWSAYVFSGAKERPDLSAPSNLQVARAADNASVAVSWSAPEGEFDNYTLQRQELVVAQGSSFFANTVTFPSTSGTWLPSSSTSYTDSSILPGRIYEYRVAVVKDDVVGDYTEWARTSSFETGFGEAPERFRKASEVIRNDRAEYWLEWQDVDGADDYELDLVVFDPTTGRRSLRQGIVVTDPTYFSTAYGRAEYRVRGRKQDASLCGSGTDARCLTPWSGWLSQGFVARQPTVGQPPSLETPPTPDASTLELRAALDAALEESLAPAGLSFDPGDIIDFAWLAFGAVVAGLVYDDGRRQGMAPFAFAVGVTFYVIYLWLGVRLVDLPQTWGVMALVVILVGGGVATAKSLGLFGR